MTTTASSSAPPVARGLPLVGNLVEYASDALGFLERTTKLHGDVVQLRFPAFNAYVLTHPDHIEHVLVAANRNFTKDWFARSLQRLLGRGLLTSEGDFWRRQRRLAQPAFHRDRINAYGQQMVASTRAMLDTWRDGSTRDLHADMMRLTLDIVSRTLFSADVASDATSVSDALESVMAYFADPVRAVFPSIEKLPLPSNRRFHAAERRLDEIIFRIIRSRRASGAKDTGDLLSMLLAAQDDDGSRMTDEQLRDEVMTIFLAGHETTAIALSWTFYLLARHPDVRTRLEAELSTVLGSRDPTLDDVSRLTYTDHVVTESMRLYPPAWSIGREAIAAFTIGGYTIPARAQVWMSPWLTHRDPRYFDTPLAFRPERWSDGLAKRLPRFGYFPFGGGPRLCIGNSFAMLEATLLLATIAQRYRLALVAGHRVEPFPAITLRPRHGVRVQLHERTPPP